jgi:hypothetical protein
MIVCYRCKFGSPWTYEHWPGNTNEFAITDIHVCFVSTFREFCLLLIRVLRVHSSMSRPSCFCLREATWFMRVRISCLLCNGLRHKLLKHRVAVREKNCSSLLNGWYCNAGRGEGTKETRAKVEKVTDNAAAWIGCSCGISIHFGHRDVSLGNYLDFLAMRPQFLILCWNLTEPVYDMLFQTFLHYIKSDCLAYSLRTLKFSRLLFSILWCPNFDSVPAVCCRTEVKDTFNLAQM